MLDGRVEVTCLDPDKSMLAMDIVIPACLFVAAMPALATSGMVGSHSLDSPLRAWIPALTASDVKPEAEQVSGVVIEAARNFVHQTLATFLQAGALLRDPALAIPLLPLGVYVRFTYRCGTEGMAKAIQSLGDAQDTAGVGEFRHALAGALAHALEQFGAFMV